MRVVVIVVAALLTLGLAAFGVVAAQRANAPASSTVLVSQIAPAVPRAVPIAAPVSQIAQAPVSQTAQPAAASSTPAEPAAPTRLAQNASPSGPVTPDRFMQNATPPGPTAAAAPASAAA